MTLNKENKRAVVKWLAKCSASDFKCAVCSNEDFAVLDDIVYLKALENRQYPSVGVICVTCNHIILFNAINIPGVMD